MINRKLKATLSLVLALIVMCSACVVPAFAWTSYSEDDIGFKIGLRQLDDVFFKNIGYIPKNYVFIWSKSTKSYSLIYSVADNQKFFANGQSAIYMSNYQSNSDVVRHVFYLDDNGHLKHDYSVNLFAFNSTVDGITDVPCGVVYDFAADGGGTDNCIVYNYTDVYDWSNQSEIYCPNIIAYTSSVEFDEESKRFLFKFMPNNDDVYNVNIAVSNQSEWDYPNSDGWYYLPMDTSGDFTKENPLNASIPLNVMRDGIMRYNSNKDIEDTGKLYFFLIAAKGKGDEALYKDRFCAASYEYSLVDTVDSHKKEPFDEKKDYENFPSLSDYIDTDFPDIRDYINFDMFHDLDGIADFVKAVVEFLWNAFTGFFRWLWAALKFVFFNLLGVFEWLGKCLWTMIKNIGIGLYNLVVDLKKLVTYLFVPSAKDLNVAIESKFPAYAKLRNAFQQGKSSANAVQFTLFGKTFDFNMNAAPKELKSALFNASTIAMYAICIYATIKALFRCFGIQLHESSESEGE